MPDENNYTRLQEAKLRKALKYSKDRIECEAQLAKSLQVCMGLLLEKAKQLNQLLGGNEIVCELVENSLTVTAKNRVLTFAPVNGAALDSKLQQPRGQYCCQIFIFGHLKGQEEGRLIRAFRLYADGLCSDGIDSWTLEQSSVEFSQYVADVIAEGLLVSDLFWPLPEDMPEFVRTVPLQGNKVHTQDLKDICVGFECGLGSKFTAITGE